ncbi:Alpha-galactosidase AgaA [Porphyridium purpureum]|uniref:alpha-galactosidase n=1 Tax=Porphyridium purpureum TaxID=35688 RepID=A0A5J4YI79_PORPP|nr:Alpha-galactosidase AgaA [Porphyridium purpureum]|eukprot:POR4153..scf237_24
MAEVSENRRLRVNMGINPEDFSWILERHDAFHCPEVIMTYSACGLGDMSRDLHRLMRMQLMPKRWREELCPILINTWEAQYFNVNHENVIELAREASKADIEMIVLDDGWFGERNDASSSLGDWYVNKAKFPFGIEGLAREIEALGMKFGIWLEPEMVNYDSQLHRNHPDWSLHVPTRHRTTGRNQFVLDFSRKDVREYIFQQLYELLRSAPISYVKWDMNRHLTEVFSQHLAPDRQGEVAHRFIMGVYEVLGRITTAFPDILFETCSGGGGRFDAGMLYYSPQIWTSDNTDAVSRAFIQYGTSLVYPVRSMGAHISTVPNHQTYRMATLKTRTIMAMMGTFGFEMDPRHWTEEEMLEVRASVSMYKRFAKLINYGDLFRLWSPFDSDSMAWMHVAPDKQEAIVFAVNIRREVGRLNPLLQLGGLAPNMMYSVEELLPGTLARNMQTGTIEKTAQAVYQYGRVLAVSGTSLMNAGIPIKFIFDSDSACFHVYARASF